MSNPAIASEPEMNTPTLKVAPAPRLGRVGGLEGHLVAVTVVVIQTSPGPACARGRAGKATIIDATRMGMRTNRRLSTDGFFIA